MRLSITLHAAHPESYELDWIVCVSTSDLQRPSDLHIMKFSDVEREALEKFLMRLVVGSYHPGSWKIDPTPTIMLDHDPVVRFATVDGVI